MKKKKQTTEQKLDRIIELLEQLNRNQGNGGQNYPIFPAPVMPHPNFPINPPVWFTTCGVKQ